ncbi:hypothetical protein QN277_011728 [Acacia crassicarpa]|uniref:Leucine-rich repeat-containing N-terminal plant-type domain-containing protein n=1 Tax=Acacia crassicarpa TaxID=499986 RepID=A0AAE1TCN4_9FABA|nr:hypothetical protein QN277_011728 [Acacia crassicarpa]
MGFGIFGFCLVLTLFFKHLTCQQPNTDGFFVSEFLKKTISSSYSTFSKSYYLSGSSYCSWQGVLCDAQKEHMVEFKASGLGLFGPIPDNTIGKLNKLQSLDLSSNKITGLPSDFWSLTSLKSLNLSSN